MDTLLPALGLTLVALAAYLVWTVLRGRRPPVRATESHDQDDAETWLRRGRARLEEGDGDSAEQAYLRALALAEPNGAQAARAKGGLGVAALARDDLETAERLFAESLALNQRLGRDGNIAEQANNLGLVARRRGNLDEATAWHEKSLTIEETLGRKDGIATACYHLGQLALADHRTGEAARLLARARDGFTAAGMNEEAKKAATLLEKA